MLLTEIQGAISYMYHAGVANGVIRVGIAIDCRRRKDTNVPRQQKVRSLALTTCLLINKRSELLSIDCVCFPLYSPKLMHLVLFLLY